MVREFLSSRRFTKYYVPKSSSQIAVPEDGADPLPAADG